MKTVHIQNNIYSTFIKGLDVNKRYILIADTQLVGMHPLLTNILQSEYEIEAIYIDAQEDNKNLLTLQSIIDQLIMLQADRSTTLIAYGGGVLLDMVGLVSLLYKRGIDIILIPTTFLSQVDSCYGGKVGIDYLEHKNILGGFKQANAIYIDPTLLTTLPKDIFMDGFFEVVKYAILQDAALFEMIRNNQDFTNDQLSSIIERCLKIKNYYVQADLMDTGVRAMLNLGHLFAHAIEKQSHFRISHGRAVGQGLYFTALFSLKKQYLSENDFNAICLILHKLGLTIDTFKDDLDFLNHLENDKQIYDKQVNFTVITSIGECHLKKIDLAQIRSTLL